MLHLSPQVISRYMNALKKKQAFIEIKTTHRDPETKLPITRREFNLQALDQLFIVLEKHEKDIQAIKKSNENQNDRIEAMEKRIQELESKLKNNHEKTR